MKRLLVCLLPLLLASAATAAGNPDARIYIDFDPPNYVHECVPELYQTFDAYVCLDSLGEGVTSISFRMNDPTTTCPGVFAPPSWISLFPGGILCPAPWHPNGTTVPSTECLSGDVVIIGYVPLFYLGGNCCLEILDHVYFPRWVVDCSDPGEVDYYCVLSNGRVGGAECPDGDCVPVPVKSSTWGAMKSLYR